MSFYQQSSSKVGWHFHFIFFYTNFYKAYKIGIFNNYKLDIKIKQKK